MVRSNGNRTPLGDAARKIVAVAASGDFHRPRFPRQNARIQLLDDEAYLTRSGRQGDHGERAYNSLIFFVYFASHRRGIISC